MLITVTRECINSGVQGSSCNDPICLAIEEQTGWDVEVYDNWIVNPLTGRGINILKQIDNGVEVCSFISKFDGEGACGVDVIEFELSFDAIVEGDHVGEDGKTRVCYNDYSDFDDE